ncbi:MAG: hypothetical protein K0Q66_281, partial [Chitinophagaceae bacterium]|nr:hypothetical protein [Chitinophagaceae bacterium]
TCDSRNGGGTGTGAPYPGDPEMIIINPIEQTLNDVTVVSARNNLTPPNTNISKHFFTIIMKSNATASLRIDGLPPTATFIPIGTSGYSYIQQNVTASTLTNPSHRITADSGFIALAYGMGTVESYGYNAGTNIIDLYQYITLQNQYATVNFPATCVGAPFKFSITLPYEAVKIKWDFNKHPGLSPNDSVVVNPPVGSTTVPADSTFTRDGKTLYVYKLVGNYTFSAPGTYPIKVLVNNPTPDGCSGDQEINYDVVVYPKPVADWSVTHSGCITDQAQFTDATNGNGRTVNSWLWEFGDATNATVKNPVKNYTAPGTYNVKLTAITDIGCITDTTKTFTVTPAPVAKFGIDSPRCVGSTLTFTDSSTIGTGSIVKWYWDFGNGNTVTNTNNAPVTQSYSAGTYNVTLQVESNTGCKSIVYSYPIVVSPYPVVDFDIPSVVCLPAGSAIFVNQTTISNGTGSQVSYLWEFSDGGTSTLTNGTHQYTATGPFTIKLTATSNAGCVKDLTKTINTIYAQPHADFTVPAEVCLRDTTYFVNTSSAVGQSITRWRWSFGDGGTDTIPDPGHLYATADTFSVSLYVYSDKGCISDTMTRSTIVNPLPTVMFNNSSPVCETKQITFTDQSVPNVGTLTNWHWNFNDGNTSNLATPAPFTHTFDTAGNYQVKLAVMSSKGCKSDTLIQSVLVRSQPKANYILPEVCLSDSYAQFVDSSYIGDGTDSSFTYLWNFGDANATAPNPNTSTVKNPVHKYTAVGSYTASVKVTSIHGCIDSIAKTFTVNGSFPNAAFTVEDAAGLCSNRDVVIKNTSTVSPGDVTKLEIYWDLLNNPTQKEIDDVPYFNKTYTHRYTDFQQPLTKTYRIRVVAYSGGTCTDISEQDVTVNASPKTQFITIPGICHDATTRPMTQGSETGGVPGNFSYSGTGVTSAGVFNPNIAGVGTHTMQYLFVSNMGCRDSVQNTITVWPSPGAKFGVSGPLCEKNVVTFTDSSVANFSNITSWQWSSGDGNSVTKNNNSPFLNTYTLAGNYIATLRVTTDSGCVSSITSKTLILNHLPRVNFGIPSICLPDGKGTFTDSSTIPDGTEASFSYLWNFGDPFNPNPSTQKNPVHQYSATGPYQVKLRVTSGAGCVDSATRSINTIYPQPSADFNFSPASVCLGDPFSFTDASSGNGGAVTQWNWRFGDGASSAIQNPSKNYSAAGTFDVSLWIYNDKGCVSDTMEQPVVVYAYPTVNAGPDLFVLEGGSAVLNPTVSGNGLTYQWTPGLYLDSPMVRNPRFTPGEDQLYRVTVTGAGGCAMYDEVFVKVLRAPAVPNVFSPNKDGIHDTWVIQYLESYPGCTVEVFDRFGRKVFFSEGYTKPWNGTINGKELPVGVYYYVIDPKNGRKPMTGSVMLLK